MLKSILKLFFGKSVPCPCGGRIKEGLDWADFYYHCDKCGKVIPKAEFERFFKSKTSE